MQYDEKTGEAAFGNEYPGAVDTCGGWLIVKCTKREAEHISRAMQRVFDEGKRQRSREIAFLLDH